MKYFLRRMCAVCGSSFSRLVKVGEVLPTKCDRCRSNQTEDHADGRTHC